MLWKYLDSGFLVRATPVTVLLIVLKLCRCFVHGMKMYMWFGIILIFFSHFLFCELKSLFWHEMLSKCMDSGYLGGATPLTVFLQLF